MVLDERDDPVAADIMTPDLRADTCLPELALDKPLEVLTRVVASDQEYFMTHVCPGYFRLCRERMTGGKGCDDAVAPQRHDPQSARQIATCDDSEIDLSALEASQQSFACALGIAKHDITICSAEFRRESREFSGQDASLDADGDLAVFAFARSPRAGIHAGHIVQDCLAPADEFPTESGRGGTGRGAGEQSDIQPLLKVVKGPADGRLPNVQETRRAVDTAVLGDCPHAQQLPQIKRRPFHLSFTSDSERWSR